MDKEHVWIKEDNGNIYYCEIKKINEDPHFGLTEYEVFPIIGCFRGFTTLINAVLTSPSICMIWKGIDRPYGKACYDLNRLINNGK
jgi:hypothetical protein